MTTRSKWLFILVGKNNTGKTSVQRNIVKILNGRDYSKLPSNKLHEIKHPSFSRKCRSIFVAGRSYQEFGYRSLGDYFRTAFDPQAATADLAFMSSHLDLQETEEMIKLAHRRFYNVGGIFFSNSIRQSRSANAAIAELKWNEIFTIDNAWTARNKKQRIQLAQAAETIVQLLISRQPIW